MTSPETEEDRGPRKEKNLPDIRTKRVFEEKREPVRGLLWGRKPQGLCQGMGMDQETNPLAKVSAI